MWILRWIYFRRITLSLLAATAAFLYRADESMLSPVREQLVPYKDAATAGAKELVASYGDDHLQLLLTAALAGAVAWQLLVALYDLATADEPLTKRVKESLFDFAKRYVPFVQAKIDSELAGTKASMKKSIMKDMKGYTANHVLPKRGATKRELMKKVRQLAALADPEGRVAKGQVSGTVYVGGENLEAHTKALVEVYGMFAWSNQLHTNVFPGVRQMEAEVVRWSCGIFNGGDETCGVVTSGGTESIIMACKAYRDYGRRVQGIVKPNIVYPRTAHPAFLKGCQYLGIAVREVAEDEKTRSVSAAAIKRAINENTIFVIGSCPQYPHGSVDPIADIAAVAKAAGVGMHVDCCLGSYVVPFMREAGFDFEPFAFDVPGVTSISADTHKYGLAPKGSSVIMYAKRELLSYQYSCFADWPGGIYGTAAMPGSRPGGLVAATWAAMALTGRDGYVKNCKAMVGKARFIAEGIRKIPGLRLVCEPAVTVVSFESDVFDINRLAEPLADECGWDINILQFPSAMHLCVTMAHTPDGVAERFLSDLAACTAPLVANPGEKVTGSGAMYGLAQSLPDRSIVEDVCKAYIDTVYTVAGDEVGPATPKASRRRGRPHTPKGGSAARLTSPDP